MLNLLLKAMTITDKIFSNNVMRNSVRHFDLTSCGSFSGNICMKCFFSLIFLFYLSIFSCATSVPLKIGEDNSPEGRAVYPEGNTYRTLAELSKPLSPDEQKLLVSADSLLGRPPGSKVTVNGRVFTLDCIGTVCAVYYGVDFDLTKDFSRYPGNGVKRLHASLGERGVLHRDKYPRTGDVVFWDNTWDANEDNDKNNDPLTHAGVVIKVEDDGTVYYMHSHIKRGIIVEVMNLRRPTEYYGDNRKIINNALAMGSGISRPVNPEHWLSGDLWNTFGDVMKTGEYYSISTALNNCETLQEPAETRISLK